MLSVHGPAPQNIWVTAGLGPIPGPEGDRTPYLFYAIEALCQLSYRPWTRILYYGLVVLQSKSIKGWVGGRDSLLLQEG